MRIDKQYRLQTKAGTRRDVHRALQRQGYKVISGKGGFWLKDNGFITLAKARTMTGIKAPKRRSPQRQLAWGDWATVAILNQRRNPPALPG